MPSANWDRGESIEGCLKPYLQRLMKIEYVKHAVLGVETIDGSLRWIGADGIAHPDETPMEVETPYWIASVTKLYIATAILKLQERGHLAIDDRMTNYLSSSLTQGLHQKKDGMDLTDQITIRHLLSHASGLPDYLEIHQKGEKSLLEQVVDEGDQAWTLGEIVEIVREAKAPLFPPQPLDQKKIKVRYSDTNFQLLIAIVEAVSKRFIGAALDDLIFKPLGLAETFHPGTSPPNPLPPIATLWDGDQAIDVPKAMGSFGDLGSTARDQLRFLRGLVTGGVFENVSTFSLMTKRWNPFGFYMSPVAPGWPIEYGLGIMRLQMPRILTPLRPTPEVVGHTGVTGSWAFYCPPLDALVVGNVSQLRAARLPFRLVPSLLRDLSRYIR